MPNLEIFNNMKTKHLATLVKYVPVVARVHGREHPEFLEVQSLFNAINEKIKGCTDDLPDLKEEFAQLRQVTNNYKVPQDTCESYEAVYLMLSDLDKAYQQE